MPPYMWVIFMATAASTTIMLLNRAEDHRKDLRRQQYLAHPERSQEFLRMVQGTPIPELLASGQRINAIKEYRERYFVSLREAKAAIDDLDLLPVLDAGHLQDIQSQVKDTPIPALINAGPSNKILAIKEYRQHFHVSLREAKAAIELLYRAQITLRS